MASVWLALGMLLMLPIVLVLSWIGKQDENKIISLTQ